MLGLERNPEIGQLLVHLYDAHKLYNLTPEDRPQARMQLTRATAELFAQNLPEKETDILTDLMIGLIRQAEKDLRMAMAEKLAVMETVPLRLILHLANDDITIASPVLKKSPVLSDIDLLYIIRSRGADYWQAIAARETLRGEVVDALAATRDVGTAVVLSRNERVVLTHYAVNILADLGKEHDSVARPLIMRSEIPENIVRDLYDYVSKDLKDYISAFHAAPELDDMLDDTVNAMVVDMVRKRSLHHMPSEEMIAEFRRKAVLGHLNLDTMMDALQHENLAGFIGMFSVYTGLPTEKIHGFLRKSCPNGMAIACRAFGIQKSDFSRIFLLTNKMRSSSRLIDHKDLLRTLRYFDAVRPDVARRFVSREIAKV